MLLYPDTVYQSSNGNDTLKRIEDFRRRSAQMNQVFQSEANTDTLIESGDRDIFRTIYSNFDSYNHNTVNLNLINRIISQTSGIQRKERKSITCSPVENGDQETADQLTKIIMHINRRESVLETVSDAFQGAIVTGLNLLQVWVDYRNDPISGDIKVNNCSYNSFMIDPYFRKMDLSDCTGIFRRTFLTKEECQSLLPDDFEEISSLMPTGGRNQLFPYLPENYAYGPKDLLSYDEFYYRAYRKQLMLLDQITGETMEYRGTDEELDAYLKMYPQVKAEKYTIPTVKLAIVVQGYVVYDDYNPLGDKYPFIPVVSHFRPDSPDFATRIQGMVRGLRDAQFLFNTSKTNEADIIASQLNSGMFVKEGTLLNPDDAYDTKGTGRILWLKQGSNMEDIQVRPAPSIPASTFQLSESWSSLITTISGQSDELLGTATDKNPGITERLRQGASLVTLRPIFDRLDHSLKLLGNLFIDIIQQNFTPGKVKLITNQEPTDKFYNKLFGKYDVIIEDGVNTDSQRQIGLAQLLHFKEIGLSIPDETIIEAATIQNKTELIKKMAEQKKVAMESEQQQLQLNSEQAQATIEATKAKAKADLGWALERTSRVEENRAFAGEREAEAAKDRQQAILNMAKTLVELDDLKLNNIQKMIDISSLMDQQGARLREDIKTPSTLEQSLMNLIAQDKMQEEKTV